MGKLLLRLPPALTSLHRADLLGSWFAGGYDMAPASSRPTISQDTLIFDLPTSDSGALLTPWHMNGANRVVSTATLRQNSEPYQLHQELLRGCLNRLRELVAALDQAQVTIPEELRGQLHAMSRQLGRIIHADPTESVYQSFEQLMSDSSLLADQLALITSEFKLDSRKEANGGPLGMRLGCVLRSPLTPHEAEVYAANFNAVRIVPNWKQIEPIESSYQWSQLDPLMLWAGSSGLDVTFGPLIDVRSDALPDWMKTWENDLPSLTAFMTDFVATLVGRYRSHVRSWQLFSHFNDRLFLKLSEDDRLRLAGRLLESMKEMDPSIRWSIGLGRPWGDYLRDGQSRYSPLVFADTLIRAGLPVTGLDLDMTHSEHLGQILARDAIDTMHVIDLFESLGIPISTTLGKFNLKSAFDSGIVQAACSGYSMAGVWWDGWSAVQSNSLPLDSVIYTQPDQEPESIRQFRQIRTHWLK